MSDLKTSEIVNIQLVESQVQIIHSLSAAEQALLEVKLFGNLSYPSIGELMQLADRGEAFDFLHDEPDIYTLEDGEPV